jgi:PAS domain S-box-containing protein
MNGKPFSQLRYISALTILFGLVLLCFIWGGLYYKIQSERQAQLEDARKETSHYAMMFEEHTVRTIKGLDQVVLLLKHLVEKEGGVDIPRLVSEKRFEGQPFVQLGVADETGELTATNIVPFVKINVADREHFQVHKINDTGRLFVSKPLVGRASGKWSIQLSRRVNKPDGSFGGIAVASIDPYYFAVFYQKLNLGEASSIALVGRDHIVRVRQSGSNVVIGQDFRNSEVIKRVAKSEYGSFTASSPVDGIERIYSYRVMRDYPLIVVAGVSETQVFKDLNQRIIVYYWVCSAISLVIVLFVAILLVGFAQRRNIRLQAILREIAETAVMAKSPAELFSIVHESMNKVLPAKYFNLALIDEAKQQIVDGYNVDISGAIPGSRQMGKGLVEYALKQGRITHLSRRDIQRLQESGEVVRVNAAPIYAWLGAPLLDGKGKGFGVMALVAREVDQSFSSDDIELFAIIAGQVSLAIERMQSNEALKSSEEKVRLLLNSTAEAIYGIDMEGRCTFANLSCLTMLGYADLSQLLGLNMHELIHHSFQDGRPIQTHECRIYIAFKEGRRVHADDEVLWRADGSSFPAEYWSYPQIVNGEVIGAVVTFNDITERKQNEEKIRANQVRYQTLMEQSTEALMLVDIQTQRVVEVNRRFSELLGYSLPVDEPLYLKQFVYDSQEILDEFYNTILSQQRNIPAETRRLRHKNGVDVLVDRAGTVINIEGRDVFLASMRDMTAERRRQAELARDIDFARRVQRELLPVLTDTPQVRIHTFYHPVNYVSGDSFLLEWHNDGALLRGFLIDVSGHGLATAIQTAAINVLLREAASTKLPLLEQLQQVNSHAAKYFTDGAYAAIIGFELDLSHRELRYVGAGITQFLANGRKIETPGMFVGLWDDAEFEQGVLPVSTGDSFCFLTDGFSDCLATCQPCGSRIGVDFDVTLETLEKLTETGDLRDDATGICLQLKK